MKRKGRLLKKAIAVILGITMAFGTLMLPESVIKDGFSKASAIYYSDHNSTFTVEFESDRYVQTLVVTGVDTHFEKVEIPSVIKIDGVEYPVTKIGKNFLKDDDAVKTVIFPESVKYIGNGTLEHSSVKDITLPDGLEYLGSNFACECPNLKSVKYNGTSITNGNMGSNIFSDSELSGLLNEKGAVILGNWLMYYKLDDDVKSLRLADLADDGQSFDKIAPGVFEYEYFIETVDLEGINYIGRDNFNYCIRLKTLKNEDDIEETAANILANSVWYYDNADNDLIKIGKALISYKTDSNIMDITSGELKGIKNISEFALQECENLDTLKCYHDTNIGQECFYRARSQQFFSDPLPIFPTYNIKNIYLDGKKVTYDSIINDPKVYEWVKMNYDSLKDSEFIKIMVEEKTKALFDQLDIQYYGMRNNKAGTLSPTEEFYIRLKIHNYLSIYDYDHISGYAGFVPAFLLGGMMDCQEYADTTHYLLQCAGVECKSLHWHPQDTDPTAPARHVWNSFRIGDEWFESDDGWNAQNNNHSFTWFALSSSASSKDCEGHTYMFAHDSFHTFPNEAYRTEREIAERTLGDINGDDVRNQTDVDLLWSYVKDESDHINSKAADINFDDDITVEDAVLLDQFVNGKAIDVNNVPTDGLAPGFKIAFICGDDYDNIKYLFTDKEGYITLPTDLFKAPAGKKLTYDAGSAGKKVRITKPFAVVTAKFIDEKASDESSIPDDSSSPGKKEGILGDVNNDKTIDIEDAVAIIQHINGMTPLTADEETRADVSKDENIDIDDAVTLISYINGNSTF